MKANAKHLVFIIGMMVVAVLSSCSKDEAEQNSSFTGTWVGTRTVSIPEEGIYYTVPDTAVIINGEASGELAIMNMGQQFYASATVAGSCYSYAPFSTGGTSEAGVTTIVTFYGSGCLNDGELTENGILIMTMNGYSVNGTWSTHLRRK